MKSSVKLFNHSYRIVELIFISMLFILLVSLGTWQLKRLEQKNIFISTIETNVQSPPVADPKDASLILPYAKIKLSGNFINSNILLYGRRSASPEKDGYYLLSPFKSINGDVFLVSRGWLPQSIKKQVNDFKSPKQESIVAIALPGEKKAMFVPENDQKNNIWFTIDLKLAGQLLGVNQQDIYLMQIESEKLPEGVKPLTTTHLNKVRNDHLEYAISWYSLAICLCLIYYIKNKQNQTR